MNLTLHLTPETEARLKEQAALAGKQPEQLVLEVLQDRLSGDSISAPEVSNEEWRRVFDDWVNGQISRNPHMDDSRESIYAEPD